MNKQAIEAGRLLTRVREIKPLVHHITNWVTIADCALIVKALGASPVMAHAWQEASQMVAIASALVLNIGTLDQELVAAMKVAALGANKKKIPVLLDCCGAGATAFRDQSCRDLLAECRIDIIKGNASEIARIAGLDVKTRGVDAVTVEADLVETARALALKRKATVAITGAEDIITDGAQVYAVNNGDPMMAHVVGTGCMAASAIGTFAAVENDHALAAAAALACFGIAGECAVKKSAGPASFKESLLDCIFNLDASLVDAQQKVYRG